MTPRSIAVFIGVILRHAGAPAVCALGVVLFLGATEGLGLMLLLPLLGEIGLGADAPAFPPLLAGILSATTGLPLAALLALFVATMAAQASAQYLQEWLGIRVATRVTESTRVELHNAVLAADWRAVARADSAALAHLLTWETHLLGGGAQQMILLCGAAGVMAVHGLIAFAVAPGLTLLALGYGLALLLILRPLGRRANEASTGFRNAMVHITGEVAEQLGAMRLARTYGLESSYIDVLRERTGSVVLAQTRHTRAGGAARLLFKLAYALLLALLVWAALRWFHLPGHSLVILVVVFARLLPRFTMLQQCLHQVSAAMPFMAACQEALRHWRAAAAPPCPPNSAPGDLRQGLRFDAVSFAYEPGRPALDAVSFSLPAREITAIVGASGAGKSTVVALLSGLLTPDAGQITVDGSPLDPQSLPRWRPALGYVPQEPHLLNSTVRANLAWANPAASETTMWEALEAAGAAEFVRALPHGLDTPLGERGNQLSGGERQRIVLAQALVRQPALLILDEASSALDDENERALQRTMEALRGKTTIVVIAHRPSTIASAGHVVLLAGGRVVAEGTWDAVRGHA